MQIQSFLIVVLMLFGIKQHRNRLKHKKIMVSAILWDVILILQIEFARSAILKASKVLTNPLMLNIHVSIALSTVVLYIFMYFTGNKILKGRNDLMITHKWLGRITMSMRILTFITSFWAVKA
jgi:hypothetical protein